MAAGWMTSTQKHGGGVNDLHSYPNPDCLAAILDGAIFQYVGRVQFFVIFWIT